MTEGLFHLFLFGYGFLGGFFIYHVLQNRFKINQKINKKSEIEREEVDKFGWFMLGFWTCEFIIGMGILIIKLL